MLIKLISMLMSLITLISSCIVSLIPSNSGFRLLVPENWEMSVGDSRTLDYVFPDEETNRTISWSAEPARVATVDEWGRVTAKGVGIATIIAVSGDYKDRVRLEVTESPTLLSERKSTVNYGKAAVSQVENLQKIVTRYAPGNKSIPSFVSYDCVYSEHSSAVTADGAVWTITDYGVLRTDSNAALERDKEQRFMGDRYFYSADTTDGKVLAIFADGKNGIWTLMEKGVTHIDMVEMNGQEKAALMSENTQENVSRRGMVSNAYRTANGWRAAESDNDGLWTSMYGAGELMRYAALRDSGTATKSELAEARETALLSSEAVLMLYYISMRSGTTEAYVRHRNNGVLPGDYNDRWLSNEALVEGGDYSMNVTADSPAQYFSKGFSRYSLAGVKEMLTNDGLFNLTSPESWSNPLAPENAGKTYAKRTRLLKGFVARTYSLDGEGNRPYEKIYWNVNSDKTATGVSEVGVNDSWYLINGENMRGVNIEATEEIPDRLWNDLIGAGYDIDDITYKGETSADELVGHMLIFKLMYDILAPEDSELKSMLVTAINNLALHLVDNSYMLVDGSGQPTTWSNFNRESFLSASGVAMAPLHAMVLLNVFKTAAYITGYQKWQDEYEMIALDPAYEYAKTAAQYTDRMKAAISCTLDSEVSPYLGTAYRALADTETGDMLFRFVMNYSDEEMAMLSFYNLFQLESDEAILGYYRSAADQWWNAAKYSENPLWYYIYQLAYPSESISDAYGNEITEVSAWSLSRHPVDTVCYLASNVKRDDVAGIDLVDIGINSKQTLTYSKKSGITLPDMPEKPGVTDYAGYVLALVQLDWTVAAPDERSLHKFNGSNYHLTSNYNIYGMEASTTYTLPYWLGIYHGLLK